MKTKPVDWVKDQRTKLSAHIRKVSGLPADASEHELERWLWSQPYPLLREFVQRLDGESDD
jgi:hypothetical protein